MERGPKGGIGIYLKRRKKFFNNIKNSVAIFFSHPEQIRNNDVHHKYRQDSCFYYLSGFAEPESVLFFDAQSPKPFTMFVREKDATRELWDGFRYGVEGTAENFGPDQVFAIKDLPTKLPELLKNADKIYYKLGEVHENDEIVQTAIQEARKSRGRTGLGYPQVLDAKELVGEQRLIKTDDEIENLRKAGEISARGHLAAMRLCKPGLFEYELEAEVEREFRRLGSERIGYGSIVGRGANATVLHYVFNNDQCRDGDLVLIDAGAEYNYYTGDITRTFPVNGRFSPAQKKFYEAVLKVQKECIEFIKPGIHFSEIHQKATNGLVDAMLELGLLKGKHDDIINNREHIKYFPHGTGHWLGMDVHDSGVYSPNGESRVLEVGMCFTVEPGLYVPNNDKSAPSDYRGLGVRIEDDVIVTHKGCEVLTALVPKEVSELEAIIGKRE